MGYVTVAYGVDIERLKLVRGSHDQALLAEMDRAFRRELDEDDPDSTLSLRDALERIVRDEITDAPNGEHQYVYAMELLCRQMGTLLDGQGHIKFLDDLGWDIAMDGFRTPLGLPQPYALPDARCLIAEDVKREYERFRDVDPEDEERPYLAEAREEYVWWLKQCADLGLGMITFSY